MPHPFRTRPSGRLGSTRRRADVTTDAHEIDSVPFPLSPTHDLAWAIGPGSLAATAPPRTDIFIDPAARHEGDGVVLNAPALLGVPPEGDYQLVAHVAVDFAATADAGVLLLWADERNWAKLCFEYSPDGRPMLVTVVCRGVADDANAFAVDGHRAWMRVSRVGQAYAFHGSTDGERWELLRLFRLDAPSAEVRLGFEVQSPHGEGCAVRFDRVRFASATLAELRDGS
jgi:regulation of enolase protein 1 (concanavalin A-like superfamily)